MEASAPAKPLAQAAPDTGTRSQTGVAMRLDKLRRSRRGRRLPAKFLLVLDDRLPLKRSIKRPDVRAAIPDETLRALRQDAERMRELTGRSFENWTMRDT
jgi:hypothetical protein